MSTETYRNILSEIKLAVIRLSFEKTRLFLDLSRELAENGRVRSRVLETEEEEDLLHLFQDLSRKLPPVALHSMVDDEDTYSHGALDLLMSLLFPTSDTE
ncbi:hypothetical protein DFQ27_008474 [Actinomortierella ambigua]|uniref:Uncharacterized protein n=1 Tax=Actinomortierella ambigua TaxID=1343610 RepID=A0A9P6PSH3_9FUNG|nr:hypothetical protein DFQ27_008474 [Actinomortierella ambigua]